MTNRLELPLRTFSVIPILTCWIVAFAIILFSGPTVFSLAVVPYRPPRYLPVWEFVPILAAVASAPFLAPQLWSWTRVCRRPGVRIAAGAMSLLGIAVPSSMPWIAYLTVLPADARWWDISSNVMLVSSLVILLTCILGRTLGPILGFSLFFFLVVLQHVSPSLGVAVPLTGVEGNLDAHFFESSSIAMVTVAVWITTLGRARLADSLGRNERG